VAFFLSKSSHSDIVQMNLKELKFLIASDLCRHAGKKSLACLIRMIFSEPGFEYTFWMRICAFCDAGRVRRWLLYPWARITLRHYTYKYGISIPHQTRIGSGFYIGHFGQIFVNRRAVIGKNCNISPGVTVGQASRGRRKGWPTIGDNVYIAPGAKIVGNVKIGNCVAIGANCVVTTDIPDNGVVVGVPGKVISFEGSQGYVNHTDY
jgi:serine O-acetyltransferase